MALPAEAVEIDFVILGDFAQVSGQKLTVVGAGWNVVNAQKYPVPLPFGLGIAFLVPWSLTNRQHHFDFVIKKSEGDNLVAGGGDFEVGRGAGMPPGITQRYTIGLAGAMQLKESGTYEILVTCGDASKTVTFEALAVRQTSGPTSIL